jgi:hypothetical protein
MIIPLRVYSSASAVNKKEIKIAFLVVAAVDQETSTFLPELSTGFIDHIISTLKENGTHREIFDDELLQEPRQSCTQK